MGVITKKKLIFIVTYMLLMFFMSGTVCADLYLAVEKPTNGTPTTVEVDIDGVVISGLCIFGSDAIGDYVKILDVTTFSSGTYTFKARWHEGSGWWSDWSDPFVAGKPGVSGNARIVE
jgi:hypothetical protein